MTKIDKKENNAIIINTLLCRANFNKEENSFILEIQIIVTYRHHVQLIACDMTNNLTLA